MKLKEKIYEVLGPDLLKYTTLVLFLSKTEIHSRYRSSMFGWLWALVQPTILFLVYYFVFGLVFQIRWSDRIEIQASFPLVLFCGLIVFNMFADVVVRAPSVIVSQVNFVKKIVFPLSVLPIVPVFAAAFNFLIGICLLLAFQLLLEGRISVSMILFPLIMIPFVFLLVGVSLLLSSLAVFFRDAQHIVGIASTIILFTSPIFYPISVVPDNLVWVVYLNPITPAVQMFRDVLIWSTVPDPSLFGWYLFGCSLFLALSVRWFSKTSRFFADVV